MQVKISCTLSCITSLLWKLIWERVLALHCTIAGNLVEKRNSLHQQTFLSPTHPLPLPPSCTIRQLGQTPSLLAWFWEAGDKRPSQISTEIMKPAYSCSDLKVAAWLYQGPNHNNYGCIRCCFTRNAQSSIQPLKLVSR